MTTTPEQSLDTTAAASSMRAAAAVLRRHIHPSSGPFPTSPLTPEVTSAVADWLEGEAAMIETIEPLVDVFAVALEHASGGKSTIELGRRADTGEVALQAMSSDFGVRLAEVILAGR